MERKSLFGISMAVIPTIVVCGLLVAASSARVEQVRAASHEDENARGCSDRTLKGDYGFALEGEILGPGLQLRGVVLQHYDGKGNISQVDHIVTSGQPPMEEWRPGSGTYTVNSNCTGSAVIIVPGDPSSPVNLHFVVVKDGREIHQVVDANAVTAVGNKVD